MTKPKLFVEGRDDLFLIVNLLEGHGVDMKNRPIEIVDRRGVEPLLETIEAEIKAATEHPIGFVLDIDVCLQDRWRAVTERIKSLVESIPSVCPTEGFISTVPEYPHPFGVWMMPDNKRDFGKLEDFVEQLAPKDNKLMQLARTSTKQAKKSGAAFSDNDEIKAVVHTWLAWQREPGLPFGTALNASFLDSNSPNAIPFLNWMNRLFDIPALNDVTWPPKGTGYDEPDF
jgi:hypothetical protein